MPVFKIKNLMVDVLSGAKMPDIDKLCALPTNRNCGLYISICIHEQSYCGPGTYNPCLLAPNSLWPPGSQFCGPCDWPSHYQLNTPVAACVGPSVECNGSDLPISCGNSDWVVIDLRKLVVNPEVIDEVRTELSQVLDAAAKLGADVTKAMMPQTVEQAQALEKYLADALAEVQQKKETLKGAKAKTKK
jgi:hypothetical protein